MGYRFSSTSVAYVSLAAVCLAVIVLAAPIPADGEELEIVEKILDAKGNVQEGALILRFPRTDLAVTVDDIPVPTAMGLVSWTGWKNMGDKTLLMGDLVLLENEVNPVISALEEAHINVAAVHNHFMREKPRLMFMHIEGVGRAAALAEGLKKVLAKTATPKQLGPESPQAPVHLNTRLIEDIMGYTGVNPGGVFRITVGRAGVISYGMEMTSSLGLNSWTGFMGTDEHTIVSGHMAMTGAEVNRVIRALRHGGIEIFAVHNHMLEEEPRIFFLHFWGRGTVQKLAQVVRSAFDQVQGPVK